MTAVTKWTVLTRGVVVIIGSNETGSSVVVVAGHVLEEVVTSVDEYVTEGLVSGSCEEYAVDPGDVEDASVLSGVVSTSDDVGVELLSASAAVVDTCPGLVALEVWSAELVEECHVDSGDVPECVVGADIERVVVVKFKP